MSDFGWPIIYALFVWWFSTVAILYLDGLSARTFRWTMAGATALAGLAVFSMVTHRADISVTGAYIGFTAGLVAWAWLEVGFYLGVVTGPRRIPASPDASGWRHFIEATQTTIYHELASLAVAALLFAFCWGEPNQLGGWTFLILWVMQVSAKLNVFFGVRNLNEEFLPKHLSFLNSYMAQRPMNLLFPLAVTLSTVVTVLLIDRTIAATDPFAACAGSFLSTMMVLAVLEHWLLVLPMPTAALWSWGLKSHDVGPAQTNADNVEILHPGVRSGDRARHPLKASSPVLLTLKDHVTMVPKS